jgi:5-methylcytosine-specific restriction endonuclease McrA
MKNNKINRDLYNKYGGRCVYCGNPVTFQEATKDHRVPKSKGGGNFKYNLLLACKDCNQYKGDNINDRVVHEYIGNRIKQLIDKNPYLKQRI